MPLQGDTNLSYPVGITWKGKGVLKHEHKVGWVKAIFSKRNTRHLVINVNTPAGKIAIWLVAPVIKEMIKFLEKENYLRRLKKTEKGLLWEDWSKYERKTYK